MSHIQNIEIKNFKSIRHAKIEDCRRVNVFIGYPNVGKSNILEALTLFSYLNKDGELPLKVYIRYKELIDLFSDGNKQQDAEIFTNEYVAALRYLEKNSIELGIISRDSYIEKFKDSSSLILKSIGFDKNGEVARSSNRDFQMSHKIKRYLFRGETRVNHTNNDQRVLNYPFGDNLSEVIRYNSILRKECGELLAEYNLKLIFDENGSILVQKQLDEFSAFQFSFWQVADTLQRLIFHRTAITTNENTILLFEEPEAHMFPPYISKFTADVMYDQNKNQYFITTHSPFVLNDFMEDLDKEELAIYAVGYKKEPGETIVRRITESEINEIYQYGIDLFFNLENYLKDVV